MDIFNKPVQFRRSNRDFHSSRKIISDFDDISLVYAPGITHQVNEISAIHDKIFDLNIKPDTIALITDGSAILGHKELSPDAVLRIMEEKALFFKEFADVDAFPIFLNTQDIHEMSHIIDDIKSIFSGISLEGIASERNVELEQLLKDFDIPVFHDEPHGLAIILVAAIVNAALLAGKKLEDLKVVINGAGNAGQIMIELLLQSSRGDNPFQPIGEIIMCDSKGIISRSREDIQNDPRKNQLANITNKNDINGTLSDALIQADVFVGFSSGNVLNADMIRRMNDKPIIFAMALPTPEIHPLLAEQAGAFVIGTAAGPYPGQIKDTLIFPGMFRGVIDCRANRITKEMKVSAAFALAESAEKLTVDSVLPNIVHRDTAENIGQAVRQAFEKSNVDEIRHRE